MKKTMRALVFDNERDDWEGSKGLRLEDVPRPVLQEREDPADAEQVVVRPIFAGFCGSDRSIWHRRAFGESILHSLEAEGKTKRVIGHEMLGEIVDVGTLAARKYGYRPRDIVSTESHIICGKCFHCRTGETHICSDDIIIGISRDGCFAEQIKLPAQTLWPTDTRRIRPEVGALQEPFGNAVHVSTKTDLNGKSVAVFGCGTIGLFTILIAHALGASRVIGVEPDKTHREMALTLGADDVLSFEPASGPDSWKADPEVVAELKRMCPPEGPDVCIEMAGPNGSVNNALRSVRRGGEVILFGLKAGDFTIQRLDRTIMDGVTIHTVIGRRIFQTWYITKGLLESKNNRIQERIWEIILREGDGTVVDLAGFEPDAFEKKIDGNPKILLKI
ncbi:MAG: alcohol dehydrogenase catalytic domain-containing protein [Candidatus Eisenbacteria bacterium]|nr:alcohol dehydrogenase catalytic domain-containing protein [Candidatus Eisenbacteria bacterium]